MYNVAMNADQLNSALVTLLSKMALPADEAQNRSRFDSEIEKVNSVPGNLRIFWLRKARQGSWKTLGVNPSYIPGSPDKFAGLMPWKALNSILEEHDLGASKIPFV